VTDRQLRQIAVWLAFFVLLMFSSIVINYPEFFTDVAMIGLGVWAMYYIYDRWKDSREN
jgi:hypothetical protein